MFAYLSMNMFVYYGSRYDVLEEWIDDSTYQPIRKEPLASRQETTKTSFLHTKKSTENQVLYFANTHFYTASQDDFYSSDK